jgi:hypothetical protein
VPGPYRLIRAARLVVQPERVEPVLDAERVQFDDLAGRRVDAARDGGADVVHDRLLPVCDERHELIQRARARGAARTEPVRLLDRGAARDLASVPGHLGPRVRLHPVHPGAAELQIVAEPAVGPGAPADTVAGLQHEHPEPRAAQLARGNQPREPGADDDHVGVRMRLAPARTAGLGRECGHGETSVVAGASWPRTGQSR